MTQPFQLVDVLPSVLSEKTASRWQVDAFVVLGFKVKNAQFVPVMIEFLVQMVASPVSWKPNKT